MSKEFLEEDKEKMFKSFVIEVKPWLVLLKSDLNRLQKISKNSEPVNLDLLELLYKLDGVRHEIYCCKRSLKKFRANGLLAPSWSKTTD